MKFIYLIFFLVVAVFRVQPVEAVENSSRIVNSAKWKVRSILRKKYPQRIVRNEYGENVNYREENISDTEVREISAKLKYYLKKNIDTNLVSIGPVTDGCDCDIEGQVCESQVFLSYQTKYIQFSRVNGKWKVSELYKWWNEYYLLQKRILKAKSSQQIEKLILKAEELAENTPKCTQLY